MFRQNTPWCDWHNKVVWIVGGSTGIGLALADQLHALGAKVAVSARNHKKLEEWVGADTRRLALALDVCFPDACAKSSAQLELTWGTVDMMIYSAGYYRAQDSSHFDLDEMMQHQAINYGGALNILASVLPIMQTQQQGAIVLIASVAGWRGLPKALGYSPTKAALQRLAEILHIELIKENIGVFLVNPGFVETPLTAQNDFKMPALIKPEQAAKKIIEGMKAGNFEIHFPKRFTCWMKILSHLPYSLYFALLRFIFQRLK